MKGYIQSCLTEWHVSAGEMAQEGPCNRTVPSQRAQLPVCLGGRGPRTLVSAGPRRSLLGEST